MSKSVVTRRAFYFSEEARRAIGWRYGDQKIATRKTLVHFVDSLVQAAVDDCVFEYDEDKKREAGSE